MDKIITDSDSAYYSDFSDTPDSITPDNTIKHQQSTIEKLLNKINVLEKDVTSLKNSFKEIKNITDYVRPEIHHNTQETQTITETNELDLSNQIEKVKYVDNEKLTTPLPINQIETPTNKPQVKESNLDEYAAHTTYRVVNMTNYDNFISRLKGTDVRSSTSTDQNGYTLVKTWLENIEKVSSNTPERIKIFILYTDDDVLTMLGGRKEVEESKWDILKTNILNISTRPSDIDWLTHLYKFHWDGSIDPILFAAKLQKAYSTIDNNPLEFNHYLKHCLTINMIEEQKDMFKSLFDENSTETLAKIASIFQEKGKTYFFGNKFEQNIDKYHDKRNVAPNHQTFNKSQVHSIPYRYPVWPYNAPLLFHNWMVPVQIC